MNVLITGGLGGLGRELMQALGGVAHARVVTFSRRSRPEDIGQPSNAVHVQGSILDADGLAQVMRTHGITHVVHAAGARTRECEANPDLAREVNITGTARVLEAVSEVASVSRLVFLSSAAVYGRTERPVVEAQPAYPASPYALTKAEAEVAIRKWAAGAVCEVAIVRPGFIVGPRTEGPLSTFLLRLGRGESADIVFPEQFHLHWAPDLTGALITMLQQPWPKKVAAYHLPGHDVSLHELANMLADADSGAIRTPAFKVQTDPATALPARLDWTRFEKDFGPVALTSLKTIVRAFLFHPP